MTAHPLFSGCSGSGLRSRSIWATTSSNRRETFSFVRADVSVKAVLPHDAASAAPSSRVTCLCVRMPHNQLTRERGDTRDEGKPVRRTYLCTAKSDLLPTSTMGTFSRPV